MSDNLFLGKKNPPRMERDAIHIAVVQMVCGEDYMSAGDHVFIMPGTTDTIMSKDKCYGDHGQIGVIDPFITEFGMKKGDRVWVFLYPNTVTGLRHEWSHPAFAEAERLAGPNVSESELWLRKFAAEWGFDYENMLDVGINPESGWGYITAQGVDLHSVGELGEDHDLFWHHLEIMTGKKYDEFHRGKVGWSCSC
jgi:hypothetical protein